MCYFFKNMGVKDIKYEIPMVDIEMVHMDMVDMDMVDIEDTIPYVFD